MNDDNENIKVVFAAQIIIAVSAVVLMIFEFIMVGNLMTILAIAFMALVGELFLTLYGLTRLWLMRKKQEKSS